MSIALRHSYGTQIKEYLRNAIIVGDLSPGERLNEAKLSEEMGISRTPLREAITGLVVEGWLEQVRHSGTFVAEFRLPEITELLRVRRILEVGALELILERPDHTIVAERLAEVGVRAGQALADQTFPLNSSSDFHLLLLRESQNETLLGLGQTVHAKIRTVRFRSGTQENRRRLAIAEHEEIIAAISRGDQTAAIAALKQHLTQATEGITSQQ